MQEWENPLGVLWDTRGPERGLGPRLAEAARRVADGMLVESTRPEAEYWPLLLPLPPRNTTRAVAVALTATSLGPLAAVPAVAAACGGDDPQPAAPARALAAATPAPAAIAAPAAAPAAAPPSAAAPAAAAAPPAPAPVATPEPVAAAPVDPVPMATGPRLVPSYPAKRKRPRASGPVVTMKVTPDRAKRPRTSEPEVTMHVTPEPAAEPVVTMHLTPESQTRTVSLPVVLSATRKPYRVRSGDSLWRIAQGLVGARAGTARVVSTVHLLWSLNHGRVRSGKPDLLSTSDVLVIPARKDLR